MPPLLVRVEAGPVEAADPLGVDQDPAEVTPTEARARSLAAAYAALTSSKDGLGPRPTSSRFNSCPRATLYLLNSSSVIGRKLSAKA